MRFKLLKKEFIFDNCGECGDFSINSIVVFKFDDCAFKGIYCKKCLQKKIREVIRK